MFKNVAYTADFDIRADFTVPLFMSSDSDIKFGNTATMSLANMMGECLKGMYESVTVEAGGASIYLHRMYGCSPIQKFRRKKLDLDYLYSVTFSVMLPVSCAEISVFDRIDTNDKVREEIENDLAVEFAIELNNASALVNAGTELDDMENATVEDAFDKINIIVNYSDEHDVFLPLFDRLAMLIDPVTNVVIETNEDDDVEYIFCGGCGEEFSTDLFNEHEITHCPYCGCRFRNPRQN
jgi:hypothetical protein